MKEKKTVIGFIDWDYWRLHVRVELDNGMLLTPSHFGDETWLYFLTTMWLVSEEQTVSEEDLEELLDSVISIDSEDWGKGKM